MTILRTHVQALTLTLTLEGGCGEDEARSDSESTSASATGATDGSADTGTSHAQLQLEAEFWQQVAICGEAAEAYSTAIEASENSDLTVVAHIVGVAPGNVVQGDAPEDFYAEVNLQLRVDVHLRGGDVGALEVSAIAGHATATTYDAILESMARRIPAGPVVLLLDERADFPGVYITTGGDLGLWTRTLRGPVDNPIAADACLGHYGDEVHASFFGGVLAELDELIGLLAS
ncbi:MAG: hypothetical protein KC468_23655 [Myxococcales bacterium]|nr:hypothetical protein [Myxococcales bacterium]